MAIWQGIVESGTEIVDYVKTIPSWVGGTVASVVTLIKWILGRSGGKLKLDVSQATPVPSPTPVVRITVANAGTNRVNVKEVYLKFGRFRKAKLAPVLYQLRTDLILPRILEDSAIVDIDLVMEPLAIALKRAFKETTAWNGGRSESAFLATVKVGVATSIGQIFETHLHPEKCDHLMTVFRIADAHFSNVGRNQLRFDKLRRLG